MLLFTNLASANIAYLQDGHLYIYDDAGQLMLLDYEYENDDFRILKTQGNYAYAGGYGGLIIADMRTGIIIDYWSAGGSAGDVSDIAVSSHFMAVGYEDRIVIASPLGVYITNIEMYSCGDIDIKNDMLYIGGLKYDMKDPKHPRCLNPGAFIAIYDNKGTWAIERVGWQDCGSIMNSNEVIGFGWSGVEPIVGDWNGDGFKEIGIYNRAGNNFLIPIDDQFNYKIIGLGWYGVTPVVGDFDGDGDDDVGVYDNKGTWALNTNNGVTIMGFGWAGTEPVVGDWNGDGIDEVGIYNRPGNNFLVPKGSSFQIIGLGWSGVMPIVGNWDSDINDEVGVYDPKTSTFALAGQKPFVFGKSGSQPIVGDVDFDGITEVGVCKPDGTIIYDTAEYYIIELQKWAGSRLIGN